jgi:hypothetical protein
MSGDGSDSFRWVCVTVAEGVSRVRLSGLNAGVGLVEPGAVGASPHWRRQPAGGLPPRAYRAGQVCRYTELIR